MLDCDDAIHSPLNVERQTGRRKEMTTLVEHGRECEVLAESIQTSSLRKFSRNMNATHLDTECMKASSS